MKRLLSVCLSAALLLLPCQRSQAPVPVGLALALKCVAIGTIGATIAIIFRCEPDYYLVRVTSDDEPPTWIVSQASAATVAKNEGWQRCEGPWKTRDEPDFRAWCNNKDPYNPMFPCGPLGRIPGPTRTNWLTVTLEGSADGGSTWSAMASTLVAPEEENWSFAVLPATGTNGLSADQLRSVAGCDAVATNAASAMLHRFRYETADAPP